jgi:3-deoxy-manno-octulosonate cytidylyltransferase (CMP-KDO synthetase)
MEKYVIVIPARFDSSRLPGKPLIDILGKPMIQWVYEKCLKVVSHDKVYIATDDIKIKRAVKGFGGKVLMTSKECLTGTDRVAEVSKKIKAEYYINIQGDEPVFNPDDIKVIINSIDKYNGDILNGYCLIKEKEDFFSSSTPKVVFRLDGRLLYMSRSPIPGNKNKFFNFGYRQVCVYAFPRKSLIDFTKKKSKTPFENEEDIEILRFLELGFDIRMIKLSDDSIPVDYASDIFKVIKKIENETTRF